IACFFFSSRRRHTRFSRDWSSDVCSSDLGWMLLIFVVTGVVSSLLMLGAVKMFNPAEGVNIALEEPEEQEEITLGEQLVQTVTAPDFRDLLSKERMLALILMAALFGIAVSKAGEKGEMVARGLSA